MDDAPTTRTPISTPQPAHPVLVIGAGFAGRGAAIQRNQAGASVAAPQKAREISGALRDLTYRGWGGGVSLALYSHSFAPHPRSSRFIAGQSELKHCTQATADKSGIADHQRVLHELLEARGMEKQKLWRPHTSTGFFRAQCVVMASERVSVPGLALIPKSTVWSSGCTSDFFRWNRRNHTTSPWMARRLRRRVGGFAVHDFPTETRQPSTSLSL